MKIYKGGLTSTEAGLRMEKGQYNKILDKNSKGILDIVKEHTFTLFNFINLLLASIILVASLQKPQLFINLSFLSIVVINTVIGIVQEVQAKRTVDKLTLITQPYVHAVRDEKLEKIEYTKIVLDDVLFLKSGDQIPVDCKILENQQIEIDESSLTGESESIHKKTGDPLWSGSMITAGACYAKVEAVGADTMSGKITQESKKIKKENSKLSKSLNHLLKFLSFIILPAGILLFTRTFFGGGSQDLPTAAVRTVSVIIGMIPEGLILLTSMSMAAGVVAMGKYDSLIQKLSSIETLARTNILCVDKTGTITTGKIKFVDLFLIEEGKPISMKEMNFEDKEKNTTIQAAAALSFALPAANETQKALQEAFQQKTDWKPSSILPFSSERKHSKAEFEGKGTWILGAPEFINCRIPDSIQETIHSHLLQGYRVLILSEGEGFQSSESTLRGVLILSDELRKDVEETFEYFHKQSVEVKIISGDDPNAVYAIAKRAGIKNLKTFVSMKNVSEEEIASKVQGNSIFGRVQPFQKKEIIRSLQEQGHIVTMVGDGVNDVPALKQADCSVAMAKGSDAAKNVSHIILLKNSIGSLVKAVYEGRRIINNIQRVASLFLVKTTYSAILAVFFVLWGKEYPIMPIQMSLINALTIGIPSFILALKPNKDRIVGSFLENSMKTSLPIGIIAALGMILLQVLSTKINIPGPALSTMSAAILSSAGILALYKNCKPFTLANSILFAGCTLSLVLSMVFGGKWIFMTALNPVQLAVLVSLLLAGFVLYKLTHTNISNTIRLLVGKNQLDPL